MEEKLILLDFWPSSYAMRVKIALADKGLDYERQEQNLVEKKSSLLLEMNPVHKFVPVLIHNGNPICESLIIVEYIDEVWNKKSPLLPADPLQRSKARFWADYTDKKVLSLGKKIWAGKGEELENAKQELIESLKTLEGELGEKQYFGGETIGFVDVSLVPFTSWFYCLENCGSFSIEASCPKIVAWAKRCAQLESVSKSLADPYKIHEFVLELKKKYGI